MNRALILPSVFPSNYVDIVTVTSASSVGAGIPSSKTLRLYVKLNPRYYCHEREDGATAYGGQAVPSVFVQSSERKCIKTLLIRMAQ